MENERYYIKSKYHWQCVEQEVSKSLANESSTRQCFDFQAVVTKIATTTPHAASMNHGNTQHHALLQHIHQDEW